MQTSNCYIDTRGNVSEAIPFSQAVLNGLAPGGGLYVPERIPRLTNGELTDLARMPYWKAASRIYQKLEIDFDATEIDALMRQSYESQFDTDAICKVVPIDDTHDDSTDSHGDVEHMHAPKNVLELWHGPTGAFKDMALQCLPHFFSAAASKQREENGLDHDFLILVATSGDTGGAALAGFADTPHVKIAVMYPDGGVSDIQHLQMTTQPGSNLVVWGVSGNFDDCQGIEKRIFEDQGFNARLLDRFGYTLSSANSINWGRLLPQIVYYLVTCGQLLERGIDQPIDVCVPTGNFGDILAAWYAKRVGAPIDRLICASNENRVLTDFINTGTYDISHRPFVKTPSPAMDILISSNLERLLFELTDQDGHAVSQWMDELARDKRFSVDKRTFARIRDEFSADSVSNDDCLETIGRVYKEHDYLIDPHTAVAWDVAERMSSERPLLIASTASWAKFGPDVYRGLHGIKDQAPLPENANGLSGCDLNERISKQTGSSIPSRLEALRNRRVRFKDTLDASVPNVENALIDFVKRSDK